MSDFASLLISVDSRGVTQGTAALDRLETQARQTERATESMNAAGRAVGPAFNLAGGGARMLTQQLSQVGQQTMASGNFMQALAIQLPDIGLAFGAVGTAVGLVAGIALPMLGAALFGAEEDALSFEDALDEVDRSIKALNAIAAQSSAEGLAELEARYGTLTAEVLALVEAQNELAKIDALSAMRDAIGAIDEALGDGMFSTAVGDIAEMFNVTERNAGVLLSTINDLDQLETFGEMADAAAALRRSLEVANGGVLEMDEGTLALHANFLDIEDAARRMALATGEVAEAAQDTADAVYLASGEMVILTQNTSAAAGMGSALADQMTRAANEAARVSANMAAASAQQFRLSNLATGVTEDERGNTGNISNAIHIELQAAALERYGDALTGVSRAASGGGGGGAAGAIEEVADISDVLNDILRDAEDPIQDFRDSMRDIGDTLGDDVGDALSNFIDSGLSDWEAFSDAMVDTFADAMAAIVAEFVTQQMVMAGAQMGSVAGPVGSIAGAIVGSLLGGLFGGSAQDNNYGGSEQERIDQEQAALREQELALLGREDLLRERELDALDESNRALQENIWALEDQAAAAEEAAQAAAELAAAEEAIAQERMSLEMQLATVMGDTEALRAMQLAQLDESNRALQEQIWAEEDRAAAIDETTRAIEEAIAAITTDKYTNAFTYQRDLALATNGLMPANSTFAPASASPVSVGGAATTGDPVLAELQLIRTKMTALEARTYKWDREGLPEERAA